MRPTNLKGLYEDKGFLWTQNRTPGRTVYGERLRVARGTEYRNWNPHRSKLAALATKDPDTPWIGPDDRVLYLGAASGTTVSHVSDLTRGAVYAVEFSSRSARDLLWNMEARENVVPIVEDAGQPRRYSAYIHEPVDVLVQDVAQRHQVDIFLRNLPLVRKGGRGFLFVKARSIQVAGSLGQIYDEVRRRLVEAGVQVEREVDLEPFEKDHRAFVVVAP